MRCCRSARVITLPAKMPPFADFELGVLCHVAGSLLSWGLGLLGYMMFQLWHDYISLILCSFLLSQSLHTQRSTLVALAQSLRKPSRQTLLEKLRDMATNRKSLLAMLGSVPPLVTLAFLLFLDIIADIAPIMTIAIAAVCVAFVFVLITWMLDRHLLAYHHFISDEVDWRSCTTLTCQLLATSSAAQSKRSIFPLATAVPAAIYQIRRML